LAPGAGYPWPWSIRGWLEPAQHDCIEALALADEIDVASMTQVWDRALATSRRKPAVWNHDDVGESNLLVKNG
jgi:aminoglycoside phosphotransferase (APT) family kinase protein